MARRCASHPLAPQNQVRLTQPLLTWRRLEPTLFIVPRKVEIERKFVVGEPPPASRRGRGTPIVQGYFPVRGDLEIRLRRKGAEHLITFKSGAGHQRGEIEVSIPKTAFESLWPFTTDGRIAKRRYKIPCDGLCIEMDFYEGPHRGLVTAEVEFGSHGQCRAFQPPPWLGREITGQKTYSNHTLARRGGLPAKRKGR